MHRWLVILLTPLLAHAAVEQEIAPAAANQFRLTVAKTGLFSGKKHLFDFETYQGVIRFEKDDPAKSSVRIEVNSKSFVLRDEWVSEKDRRKITEFTHKEMLETERYPAIRFVSSKAEAAGEQIKVTGDLTIRNITKPVVVWVRQRESSADGMLFEGQARFRMTDFGLKPPTAALGAIGTRDEVELSFVLKTRFR
ncbi:MAG: YceI family protein [Bryobacteraceae bacterium]